MDNIFDKICYKSAGNYIIKLGINHIKDKTTKTNLNRSNCVDQNYASFRTNKAFVIKIYNKDDYKKISRIRSDYSYSFKYITNKWVHEDKYDDSDDEKTYTTGIHFFLTEEPAYFWEKEIKDGELKEWYSDGKIKSMFMYKNGQLDQTQKRFYDNSQLMYEWFFLDGKRYFNQKGYYKDGTLMYDKNYYDNLLHGVQQEFYPDASPKLHENFYYNSLKGEQKAWYDNGDVRYIINHTNSSSCNIL